MGTPLGMCLLYVGLVLTVNGIARISKVPDNAQAIIQIIACAVSFVINIFMISQGEYYAAATGLLFGFTYFFQAMNGLFKIDTRPYGWFSLFVAINTIPCAIIDYQAGDPAMAVIWLAWGVLWFTGWVECVAKKDLKHFVSVLLILEGIFSAWIPGFLMLRDMWPWG